MGKHTAAHNNQQQHTGQRKMWYGMPAAMPMAHTMFAQHGMQMSQQQPCPASTPASAAQHMTATAPQQSPNNAQTSHFTRRQDHQCLTVDFCSSIL